MDSTDEVIIERRGSAGIIRLNRPKALNSLTLPMVRAIASALEDFAADPLVGSVIVLGEGERGFCAGGDIRLLHQSGKEGSGRAETFWREEFLLNHAISRYAKPYVVLMDGITMGGGVGLSAHGSHRIVTERTRLAMPETGIGYFPDVGATWLLPRAPGEAGTWMGLTGLTIAAADAIHAGFADHCVASSELPALVDAIAALATSATAADVHALIRTMAVDAGESRLAANRDVIDRAFSADTVEGILAALTGEPGEFAAEAASVIASRSPTSLKLTLRLLRAGRASADLAECLNRELGACKGILYNHDFYEGVRAAVIDKDRNPKWSPASLAEVTVADIDRFFVPAQPPLFTR
ncbi:MULTISPECIES: enoyl-CoA hydratase/isomerase family protein [unclassified Rhizobium]|uniref:enoyl-CoA hydratase/isomerase family protein n=1 Tax=unclassified Rhizobium TaxID=2613769 RepID=UPI00160A00A2|nr:MULTISPECIES: enoyl-CoA hydratase/isomerase family protein [unclassified Rhizobium]MBB3287580.1 enoyl-CoA hydratase [Rhizobium sp. BK252]MBB3402320.1 enoyl-CoA hydratase [Rhizobium sp. BK289]MBB3414897.1 enoyl-CoA hydratase [Rhizobium sp. BK284]MBB3482786.1 enoyl-CoA hydratase [Rhizobium sp. BK347]MDK4721860.1 enoyl-CoA hydratase/isomerase family protein [Rhizobium sp. CNPSo 3968]